ncbi:MAG: hypothetical protein ACLRWQ_03890 [Flavonifractor plautii]
MRLYRPLDGRKEYTGVLKGYDGGDVTIETAGEARTFVKGCGAGAPDGAFKESGYGPGARTDDAGATCGRPQEK